MNELLQKALHHHRAGLLPQAEALYRQILHAHPNHPDALHLLGVIAHQVEQYNIAVEFISQAIRTKSTDPSFYSNLGLAYHALGRLDEAVDSYQQAIAIKPDVAEVYNNLGFTLMRQGQMDMAVAYLQQALVIRPEYAEAHFNLGSASNSQGKSDTAITYFRRTIALKTDHAEAHVHLGNALCSLDKLDDAVAYYQRALVINPDHVDAHTKLGIASIKQGKLGNAIACFRSVLALRPNNAEAQINLGVVFFTQGKLDEAATCYRQALDIDPNIAEAHENLAYAFLIQGKQEQAMTCFQQALAIKPGLTGAYSSWLCAIHYVAACSPSEILAAHLSYAKQFEVPLKSSWPAHTNDRTLDRRLKIGYVSPDLRVHSVAFFIEPLLAHHDKSQVEVYGYFNYAQRDAVTDRIYSYADHWFPCRAWSDDALARRILEDRIDILVDLTGHTADNRLLTFARKPAPIQVTYLTPGTAGLSAIDYRFSTLDADPPGNDSYNTEILYRLPHALWCYRPHDDAPDVSSSTPAQQLGHVTFGYVSFTAKISSKILIVWAEILHAAPHSRFVIGGIRAESARQTIIDRFAQHGISPDRLTLYGILPKSQFRDLLAHIDIALDSFPHGGLTSSCELLWMGIPVISLCGQSFVSRFGYVLLKALKLEELVAHTPQDYVRIAANLATNIPRLTVLRETLRARLSASTLCDERRLTRDIELAYRSMWHTWCLRDHYH